MTRLFTILGSAVLLLSTIGCSEKAEGTAKPLATINGKPITFSEFELRWSQLPEYARKKYAGTEGHKRFLDELIDREVLIQEAKKRGIDRERTVLERIERFKERSILDVLVREEVDSRVTVSPEEVKAYYDNFKGTFTAPDEFRASHILVRTEGEATEVKKRLAQGEDFAALARKVSIDATTKNKGGDLGVIKRGQTVAEFEKALMTMKTGEVSVPIATQFGYHVIILVDRSPGRALSFEEAKEQVKEQVLIDKKQQRFKDLVAALRTNAKLQVSDAPIPISDGPAASPAADAR